MAALVETVGCATQRMFRNCPPNGDTLIAMADYVTANLLGRYRTRWYGPTETCTTGRSSPVDGQSPFGLLDFDDTAQAEAALDLANLDVHLELRVAKTLTPARYLEGPHRGAGHGRNNPWSARTGSRPIPTALGCDWPVLRFSGSSLATRVLEDRVRHRQSFGPPSWPPAGPSDPGADHMGWHPPVPAAILDADNTNGRSSGPGPTTPRRTTPGVAAPVGQESGQPTSGRASWSSCGTAATGASPP